MVQRFKKNIELLFEQLREPLCRHIHTQPSWQQMIHYLFDSRQDLYKTLVVGHGVALPQLAAFRSNPLPPPVYPAQQSTTEEETSNSERVEGSNMVDLMDTSATVNSTSVVTSVADTTTDDLMDLSESATTVNPTSVVTSVDDTTTEDLMDLSESATGNATSVEATLMNVRMNDAWTCLKCTHFKTANFAKQKILLSEAKQILRYDFYILHKPCLTINNDEIDKNLMIN